MSDKIKLTDCKILRINLEGYIPEELIDQICNVYENYPILNEKAEKFDILESAKTHEALVRYAELEQENKQLKDSNYNFTVTNEKLRDSIESINDDLGNKLQVKTLEIEGLKQKLEKIKSLHNCASLIYKEKCIKILQEEST